MNFEVNERLSTRQPKEQVLQALEARFNKIAAKTQREGEVIRVKSIEASFGSINRADTTLVTIKTIEGGFLMVADVNYRPSIVFWIIIVITLFGTGILWFIPIVFYLFQKKTVRSAIEECFKSINNEFHQNVSAPPPMQVPPPVLRPAPPESKLFVFFGTEVKGPYSRDQLRALLDAGSITPETQVCVEGTETWQPLSQYM
jgi:hypothetical protein